MDDAGAGEVDVAVAQPDVAIGEGAHPGVRVPAPVDHHRVDETGDDDRVDEVGRVLGASRQGAGHDRGCRGVADAVGEGPADEPEGDASHAGVDHVLHQDVRRLLGADEARREHGETGLHEEHEEARDQQPGGVNRADDVSEVLSTVLGGDHGNDAEREQTACKHGGRPAQGR